MFVPGQCGVYREAVQLLSMDLQQVQLQYSECTPVKYYLN